MDDYKEIKIGDLTLTSYAPENGPPYLEVMLPGDYYGDEVDYELNNGEVEEMLSFINAHKYRVRQANDQA